MSRKAKLAVFRDKLELISKCPGEILNKLDPTDEDFDNISKAEIGDLSALRDLAQKLYDIYGEDRESNAALYYFLEKGIEAEDDISALLTVRCIERFSERFDLLEDAISLLSEEKKSELVSVIKSARLKRLIKDAETGNSYSLILAELQKLELPNEEYVRLYLKAKLHARVCESSEREAECTDLSDIPNLLSLPLFGGDGSAKGEATDKEIAALKRILSLVNMDEWRDFWLIAVYEYATLILGGDLSRFANDIIDAVSARVDYPRKALHLLALTKRLNKSLYSAEEYEEIEKTCRFEGLDFDISDESRLGDLIKEAVYTSGASERELGKTRALIGNTILHARNRYILTAKLSNHQKRAANHRWDTLISIKTDSEIPPVIADIPITDRYAQICRNGIVLDKEKKVSQVICSGDVIIKDRAYPLVLDLILDISYVSTTKCTHATVKTDRAKRIGEYLVMHASIIIY